MAVGPKTVRIHPVGRHEPEKVGHDTGASLDKRHGKRGIKWPGHPHVGISFWTSPDP